MRPGFARRGGWTRRDFVVVVCVALTALGLLASVIFRVRAPSKQIECGRHFQLLGTAIHAYSDSHHFLPASCVAPGYATWAVQLAPYLTADHDHALVTWDLAAPYSAQPAKVRAAQVWLYFCPARRGPPQLSTSGDIAAGDKLDNFPGALGDYGCAPTSDQANKPWDSPAADGALVIAQVQEQMQDRITLWTSRVKLEDLKRGLSYTVLLGEKHVPASAFGEGKLGDGSIYNGANSPSFARIVDKEHPLAKGPEDAYVSNFGSWHPGVCQFLMGDSSLRILANDIDPRVLQLLIPRQIPEVKE